MKLLRVIASVDPATGGPVTGLRSITPPLEKLGVHTEFLTVDSPVEGFLQSWVGPVHALGPVNNRYAHSAKLRPWLENNLVRYDAVIVHGLWQDLGRAVRAACLREGRTPYFVFPHGMMDPSLRSTYPLRHVRKWLYWQLVEQRILRDARAVFFTCEEERRLASVTFPRYQCNGEVVPYGAAVPESGTADFRPTWHARCPAAIDRPFWLFLSRIHSKKGVDLLLRAYAAARRAAPRENFPDLAMAGPCLDTGYLAALKKIAESEGITPYVNWVGMLTGDAKWGAFQDAEAFILPSHQENFGIAVVEALACGKPVLISDRVNIWPELAGDGAALVEPDTAEGTTRLLLRWLALSAEARAAMGAAAAESFKKRFEIGRAAKNFAQQLDTLLSRAPAKADQNQH